MTERPASQWHQDGWDPPTVPEPPERSPLERVGDVLRKVPKVGWAGLVVVAFFAIPALDGAGDDEPDTPSVDDRQYAAFDVCTDFVRDRLKAPSTASFRNYFEDDGEVVVSGSGNGPFTVTSTVDSENGFGANIRSSFICIVTLDGTTWRLQDIAID